MSALQQSPPAEPQTVGDLLDQTAATKAEAPLRDPKEVPEALRSLADTLSAVAFDDRTAMLDATDVIRDAADLLEQAQAPGAGHNAPPLAELLTEETAGLRARADELLATAKDVAVTDEDSAERAVALAKMIGDQANTIEAERKTRKEPFLDSGRTVDAHFNAIKGPLDTAKAALVGLIDKFRRKKAQDAEVERKRLEAERLRAEAEADAAAAKAEMSGSVESAITAQQAVAKAETATAAVVAAAKPVTIKSGLGASASGRKVAVVTLDDTATQTLAQSLTLACAYLIETQPDQIREFVQTRFNALARSGARKLPGATVTEDTATTIR